MQCKSCLMNADFCGSNIRKCDYCFKGSVVMHEKSVSRFDVSVFKECSGFKASAGHQRINHGLCPRQHCTMGCNAGLPRLNAALPDWLVRFLLASF